MNIFIERQEKLPSSLGRDFNAALLSCSALIRRWAVPCHRL
jgi:hypothetical protein